MTLTAVVAAAVVAVVASAALFFLIGKRAGSKSEVGRQLQAKATAEETAKRILDDATREADSLKKSAVLSGKEELIRLREDWELEELLTVLKGYFPTSITAESLGDPDELDAESLADMVVDDGQPMQVR